MRIILDTVEKTITVPWNYTDKLAEKNKTLQEAMGADAKLFSFKDYIDGIWKEAMANSDTKLKTAQKPKKPDGKRLD